MLYDRPRETCILALQGFARKDKWLRHLKREHKDKLDKDYHISLEECEPRGRILVELKRFKPPYYGALGRVQHDDGTWGNWYGVDYDRVASEGFQPFDSSPFDSSPFDSSPFDSSPFDSSPFDPKSTVGPDLSALLDAQRNSSVGQLVSPLSSPSTSEGQSTSADGESAPPTTSMIDPSTLSEAQIWRNYAAYTGHSSFNHYEATGTGQNFSNGYF